MKLGLTGGIACGKSTVSAMLAERGAKIVDADQTAREVVLPGEAALEAIVAVFGQAVLNEDGTMNRSALGSIVFSDPRGSPSWKRFFIQQFGRGCGDESTLTSKKIQASLLLPIFRFSMRRDKLHCMMVSWWCTYRDRFKLNA